VAPSSHARPGTSSPKQASLPRNAGSSLRARQHISPPSLSLPIQAADQPARNTRQHETVKPKDAKAAHEEGRKDPLRERQFTKELIEDFPSRQSIVPPTRVSHYANLYHTANTSLTADSGPCFLRGSTSYKLPRLKAHEPYLW
jgi:hypothetical protein